MIDKNWRHALRIAGIVLMFATCSAWSQVPIWQEVRVRAADQVGQAWVRPAVARTFVLNHAPLREVLNRAPIEFKGGAAQEFELPMPDGTISRFHIEESPIMAPELAAEFPEIKTYIGYGIDDPGASLRFDVTPSGFHAQVLSPNGAVYIDPYTQGDTNLYSVYYKRDYQRTLEGFQCFTQSRDVLGLTDQNAGGLEMRSGTNLRTYRLACAATGEYTAYHGGTVPLAMSAIVTAINRVNGIYEKEVAIRLVLVANNNLIVFTDGNSDPYSNSNGGAMLSQNQEEIDDTIGSANYDIGHVFSTGGGGVAYLGCVCEAGGKAGGVTGLPAPTGDTFYVDYVAHEMGHQFGGNHTFNSIDGSCGGNRNSSTAFEPGSGSTIMAYAGICDADDLQVFSDPYFHSKSFDEILAYSTIGQGNGCAVVSPTGNTVPTVSAGTNYTIPGGTPFTLTAAGSDANGDVLTYCWEQRDLGPAIALSALDNGSSPLFRSFNPTTNVSRTFPKLTSILSNTSSLGERLPTRNRILHFRVTARDNRAGGGGVNTSDMQVTVSTNGGPFAVTSPNTSVTWSNLQTVTWSAGNTAIAPINVPNVRILLSTNGGTTFPIVLAASTPNDGSEPVQLPNVVSTQARIKVEALGNIFFDISNVNFSLQMFVPTPTLLADGVGLVEENCPPTNGAIDPAETVTVSFTLKNVGTGNTTNLVGTLLTSGGVTSPSAPQNFGAIIAGGASVSRSFTFTVSAACGQIITPVLQLQDGAANRGNITNAIKLGVITTVVTSFTNASVMELPDAPLTQGRANPYPSILSVSNVQGDISKVTVSLLGISHQNLSDLDMLLVSPSGRKIVIMSDNGLGADLD